MGDKFPQVEHEGKSCSLKYDSLNTEEFDEIPVLKLSTRVEPNIRFRRISGTDNAFSTSTSIIRVILVNIRARVEGKSSLGNWLLSRMSARPLLSSCCRPRRGETTDLQAHDASRLFYTVFLYSLWSRPRRVLVTLWKNPPLHRELLLFVP